MIPRKVVLENFLSFGTPAAVVEFTDGEPLWVLCGPNGVGKSAVFDAITYALFGCHRGGKGQGMDDLVRHGANGFRVEFEFGVGGREYRVTRTRTKKSVERLFQKAADGSWPELDVGVGKDAIKAWAERELGLTFEQFTASVLLRQGEADRIILATGKERLAMLKKVIGVERYENLSKRVTVAAKAADSRKEKATDAVTAVPAVEAHDFAAAITAERDAGTAYDAARADESAAAERIAQAKEFAHQSQRVSDLTAQLDAAAARRARADRIRADHARLAELDAALPTLTKLVPARDERARLAPERDRLAAAATEEAEAVRAATTERDRQREAAAAHKLAADQAATALRDCETARKADAATLKVAEEVETIDRGLAAFAADLDDHLRAALAELASTRTAAAEARDALVDARSELKRREKDVAEFGTVEVGAKCLRCRQPVSADHAADERRTLDAAVTTARAAQAAAASAEAAAKAALATAEAAHLRHAADAKTRDTLSAQRVALTRHAAPPAAADLRTRLTGHEQEAARLSAAEADERAKAKAADAAAKTAEATRAAADATLTTTQARLRDASDKHLKAESTLAALLDTLPAAWADRWDALTPADLVRLSAERVGLTASGIAADFRALDEDDARDAERARQRDEARAAIDAIPEPARVPVPAAEAAAKAARTAAEAAAAARDAATRALAALHARKEQRETLVAAETAAEADARVHAKLNRHLGADGLQRELVRSAERQIVHFADETVRHLSDGDLTIALDDDEAGPDKAFTLKVRRADGPAAIGVSYLSGSQKFRVAVAVALGIGRFATSGTQARPLESVIIDEGFGSLDKDGLRCMADELHRLKDKLALKRVVLVSHQDDFVAQFPVGYRLAPADGGTTAERFRR